MHTHFTKKPSAGEQRNRCHAFLVSIFGLCVNRCILANVQLHVFQLTSCTLILNRTNCNNDYQMLVKLKHRKMPLYRWLQCLLVKPASVWISDSKHSWTCTSWWFICMMTSVSDKIKGQTIISVQRHSWFMWRFEEFLFKMIHGL